MAACILFIPECLRLGGMHNTSPQQRWAGSKAAVHSLRLKNIWPVTTLANSSGATDVLRAAASITHSVTYMLAVDTSAL